MEPFDVVRSSDAFGAESFAFPNNTPAICDFELLVRSISASLNLIVPFEVLASNRTGVRSERLTEIAPLLVSNLHFPSREHLINWITPLLELACMFPAEFSTTIFPLLVES